VAVLAQALATLVASSSGHVGLSAGADLTVRTTGSITRRQVASQGDNATSPQSPRGRSAPVASHRAVGEGGGVGRLPSIMAVTRDRVLEALKTVNDPELQQDLVSLDMVPTVEVDGRA